MRFEVTQQQANYFSSFGFIEFENVKNPFFAKIAAALIRKQKIRLLFEQKFTYAKTIPTVFDIPRTLAEISCFQDVVAGALFPTALANTDPLPPPFPTQLGNILFIKADHPFDWKPLFSPHCYTLLTFGEERSIYIYNENDPHTHDLKKKGYVFGDSLKQEDCPLFHFGPL